MGRLGGLRDDSRASTWQGDVEDLLYEGEDVERTVDIGDGQVVVTSHRVLVFTPDGPGTNFAQVDRPNVVGVDLGHDGNAALVERAIRYGIVGVVMMGAGQVIDLGGIVSDVSFGSAAGRVGLGQLMRMLGTVMTLLANLDEILTMLGALAVLLAVFVAGVYFLTRDRVVVVERAGEDDHLLPVSTDVTDEQIQRVRDALTSPPGSDAPTKPHGSDAPGSDIGAPPPGSDRPDGRPARRESGDGTFKSDDPLGPADGRDGGA